MEWKYTEKQLPITYKTGDWDGKKSDEVIAEDADGKKYIAVLYSGFMDGSEFNDWYTNDDWCLSRIVRWFSIPE
jgi:hypothetical protein